MITNGSDLPAAFLGDAGNDVLLGGSGHEVMEAASAGDDSVT